MKKSSLFLQFLGVLCFQTVLFGQSPSEVNNMRSDTIDVIKYDLQMDFTQASNSQIKGSCKINFKSKMNGVDGISFDLLQLTVDSVQTVGTDLSYTYNDTLLRIQLNQPLTIGDMDSVTVYYHGTPQTDPSGFGGFYFQGSYSYNMGVGFDASPHNYGRVWHPCFDNFVERAMYDIQVKSPSGRTSYSNGVMVTDSISPNNENVRRWKMEDPIPSYLACVGVAPYTHVNQMYTSNLNNNQIPVVLAARPQDTSNLKNSFAHLFDAMDVYESSFGPYRWDKIGFTLVPFTGGAMEHATCIMYPTNLISGGLQYETVMAHELSHHWWGNLVTCRTAEDMWINEGLAAYCEPLFLEHVYNHESYIENLKETHKNILQSAHYKDGAFYSLSGVPESATYGVHTYDKGATMAHNLRTYMGDTEFFKGLKAIQDNYAFQDINAEEFRDELTNNTNFNADQFFDDYIFNPGFNGFEIDSFEVESQGGQYEVTVHVQQKLFEAPHLFEDVPMQVTFVNSNWGSSSVVKTLSGGHTSFMVSLPYSPEMVYLNKDSQLLNAVTSETLTIVSTGFKQLKYAKMDVRITAEEDSSLLRIEHCRIPPDEIQDPVTNNQFAISPNRFWKVDGLLSNTFEATASLRYDARNVPMGNLDNGLMVDHENVDFHEDSLVLLWRPNQKTEWIEYDDYDLTTLSNKTDGYGYIDILNLKKGEYTFGFRKRNVLNTSEEKNIEHVKVFPNPSGDSIYINWKEIGGDQLIKIYNDSGKFMKQALPQGSSASLSIKGFSPGIYHVVFYKNQDIVGNQKFIKK